MNRTNIVWLIELLLMDTEYILIGVEENTLMTVSLVRVSAVKNMMKSILEMQMEKR